MRITDEGNQPKYDPFGVQFKEIFKGRLEEANEFYSKINSQSLGPQQQLVLRQAYAGTYDVSRNFILALFDTYLIIQDCCGQSNSTTT